MSNNPKIGVFLCQCGQRIAPKVSLAKLYDMLSGDAAVAHCQIVPYTCQAPGLAEVRQAVEQNGLNRVVVAGCEARLMTKKFEKELSDLGILKGQVEVVNLRDHVASSNNLEPDARADKAFKLIKAAVAGQASLSPSGDIQIEMNGPVMILGGGIASYAAAHELAERGIETIMTAYTDNTWDEIRMLHEHYPV